MTIAIVDVVPGQDGPGTIRMSISGEIDIENAAEVEGQILDAIDNHATAVQLDLTELVYMDSSGLRIMFNLASRLGLLQIRLEVVAPHGSASRRVLELSGFEALRT